MTTDIFSKNIELNDALREFVSSKVKSIEKLIKNAPAELRIEVAKPSRHHRSGAVFYAEFNLKIGGRLIRVQAYHDNLHTAITQAKDDIRLQIKKFKEKRASKERKSVIK